MLYLWLRVLDRITGLITDHSLVQTIDEMLTSMAGYLDFNTFNLNVISNSNDNTKTPIDTEDEAET